MYMCRGIELVHRTHTCFSENWTVAKLETVPNRTGGTVLEWGSSGVAIRSNGEPKKDGLAPNIPQGPIKGYSG